MAGTFFTTEPPGKPSLALQLSSTLPFLWMIWHPSVPDYTLALTDSPGVPLAEDPREGKAHLTVVLRTCPVYHNICWNRSKLSRGVFGSCTECGSPGYIFISTCSPGLSCPLHISCRFPLPGQIQQGLKLNSSQVSFVTFISLMIQCSFLNSRLEPSIALFNQFFLFFKIFLMWTIFEVFI